MLAISRLIATRAPFTLTIRLPAIEETTVTVPPTTKPKFSRDVYKRQALAAAATAHYLGATPKEIAENLHKLGGVHRRFEIDVYKRQ